MTTKIDVFGPKSNPLEASVTGCKDFCKGFLLGYCQTDAKEVLERTFGKYFVWKYEGFRLCDLPVMEASLHSKKPHAEFGTISITTANPNYNYKIFKSFDKLLDAAKNARGNPVVLPIDKSLEYYMGQLVGDCKPSRSNLVKVVMYNFTYEMYISKFGDCRKSAKEFKDTIHSAAQITADSLLSTDKLRETCEFLFQKPLTPEKLTRYLEEQVLQCKEAFCPY